MSRIADDLVTVRELGKANARVTLVRHLATNQLYCKKSIVADADNWESQLRQMRNEFDVGRLNAHRALRKSVEFGVNRKLLRATDAYLLLDYVEGVPFGQWAESNSVANILKVCWHVAAGLGDLHARGLVHADLKPQNVLCAANGRPTLIDFGQSCPMMHVKERIQGTADFIAPEQVNREPLDGRTDVFALGASLHLILLGRPAQTELNDSSVRRDGKITLDRRTTRRLDGEAAVDPAVIKLIEDCLAPERRNRPTNMQQVKDRFELCFVRLSRSA